jgi:hypothetical protein
VQNKLMLLVVVEQGSSEEFIVNNISSCRLLLHSFMPLQHRAKKNHNLNFWSRAPARHENSSQKNKFET